MSAPVFLVILKVGLDRMPDHAPAVVLDSMFYDIDEAKTRCDELAKEDQFSTYSVMKMKEGDRWLY
jgi:hypothetical protein